ncbi:phytase [Woodsholea maritima]|uniref:phytase n=1 Tax=Woodsholea maritima TaxID=240237 RepID=UPI00036F84A5|nr:phytase [Woodsholea maritima]
MKALAYCAGVSLLILTGACSQQGATGLPTKSVQASIETVNVAGTGDAADDPAVWLAPNPQDSLILGTDKTNGLYAYNLDGSVHAFLPVGRVNNVDVRTGFMAGEREVALAAASDRTNIAIATFFIDAQSREISQAPGGVLPFTNVEDPYGFCLYHDQAHDAFYAFTSDSDAGVFIQTRLSFDGETMQGQEIRRINVGSKSEGCAVDDRTGLLYIAEEEVGLWRYSAAPEANEDRILIAPTDGQHLTADIEGVAIMETGETGGWLFVSSQGDDAYAVFDLETGAFIDRFRVTEGVVDATSYTDGIEVFAHPLGPDYPEGVFLAQDDEDNQGGQNFKLVDLRAIKTALSAQDSDQAGDAH